MSPPLPLSLYPSRPPVCQATSSEQAPAVCLYPSIRSWPACFVRVTWPQQRLLTRINTPPSVETDWGPVYVSGVYFMDAVPPLGSLLPDMFPLCYRTECCEYIRVSDGRLQSWRQGSHVSSNERAARSPITWAVHRAANRELAVPLNCADFGGALVLSDWISWLPVGRNQR